jgi:chemotaxis signal transduction protein
MMGETRGDRVVVCRVGGRRFALPLKDVREVCTEVAVVRVPGVAAPVEGVANVRGSVVTVIRAGDLLGEPSGSAGPSPWLVVLRYRDGRVALGVDDVEDLGPSDAGLTPLEVGSELAPLFEAG